MSNTRLEEEDDENEEEEEDTELMGMSLASLFSCSNYGQRRRARDPADILVLFISLPPLSLFPFFCPLLLHSPFTPIDR